MPMAASAADDDDAQRESGKLHDDTEQGGLLARHGFSVVTLPIPTSDPTLGTGLTLPVLLLYKPEGSSRPWMTGFGAMVTSSDSWGVGAFQKAYLFDDRLRVTAGLAYADLQLRFYGVGSDAAQRGRSVPIEQRSPVAFVKALWRVAPDTYAGLRLRYNDVRTSVASFSVPDVDLTLPGFERDVRIASLGLSAEVDTRDSEQNPRSGSYGAINADFPREATGSTYDYQVGRAFFNHYRTLDAQRVLALRAMVCSAGGDVPYFSLCQFGAQGDLRGYETGRYRDRSMFAAQAEYRWRFSGRWGVVGFAGVGGVAPKFKDVLAGSVLPSVGIGLRWQASQRYDMNVSADFAWGKDGNEGFYLRIGEAF